MLSNINTTIIDTTYPIAGQDNDSQGFRDNFSNTNSNFISAKSEIEDIQNKGIFKSALDGSNINNDMNGTVMSSANLVDTRETVVIHNELSGTINLSIKEGSYHTISPTSPITLQFSNGTVADWPSSGEYSKIRVEIAINDPTDTITLPASVSNGAVLGQNGQVITVNAVGVYTYEFSTRDGGVSVTITAISNPQFLPGLRTIATSVGTDGDLAGMSAFDAGFIYTCVADWDGSSNIWYRVTTATSF